MKKRYLAAMIMAIASPAWTMPATETVRALLDSDVELAAARALKDASEYAASNLAASPYEWTLELAGQQRQYDTGGASSREWSAGIQRGVRWPNKMILDHKLGDAAQQEARWRYELMREQSARDFLTLWLDWAQARTRERLMQQQQALAADNVSMTGKRLQAGDAAIQDISLANAELSALASQVASATQAARQAENSLRDRFPGVPLNHFTLPDPTLPEGDQDSWRRRILEVNPGLALTRLKVQQTAMIAQRARAERLPDPTLGIFTASEARSTESIIGINISMPLPGGKRFRDANRASAEASAAELISRGEIRRWESQATQNWQNAHDSLSIWQLAEQSSRTQSDSAQRSQKAYRLGELTLQELLQIRRQAISMAETALTARVNALRAVYTLEINAHKGWLATSGA